MAVDVRIPIPETCYRIICDAMVDAGKLGQGREPNSEQLAENERRLNKLFNYLQTQGIKPWLQQDISLAAPVLQAGKSAYSLGDSGANITLQAGKPRRVIEAYYTDASTSRRPLDFLTRNQWDSLSTTTQQGTITAYYVDKALPYVVVNLWMTPNAQAALGTVHLIVDLQVSNFSRITDTMNFPSEWALCLEWGLADQISIGAPEEIVQKCAVNAMKYQMDLENWDVEDGSVIFTPDPRSGYQGRKVGRY